MKKFGKKLALVTLSACMALFFAACSSDSDNSDPTQPAQSSEDGQNGEGQGGEGGDQPAAENTFTDPRDGKTYKFVTIGSQTWFAQNLNFDMAGSSCYDDNPATAIPIVDSIRMTRPQALAQVAGICRVLTKVPPCLKTHQATEKETERVIRESSLNPPVAGLMTVTARIPMASTCSLPGISTRT